MANRILKESICTSHEIDALNWFEEGLFYRLIVSVDDYGVYPADPVMLAHMLFPRKENVSAKTVEQALKHLEEVGLIRRFNAKGKGAYLELKTWSRHQRLRNSRRKYPAPEEDGETAETAESCEPAEEPYAEGEAPEENLAEQDPEKTDAWEDSGELPVITLPLNDGSEYRILQSDVDEFNSLYPAVDVLQELRTMRGWCLSNEKKRKTRSGIRRFVNGWMARAQDRGGNHALQPGRPVYPDNPYQTMVCEGEVV